MISMMPMVPTIRQHPDRDSGFTLVEMIMVIVITGIIAGIVAIFMRLPIKQYMDVARRAQMTDVADTALRRIARDLRIALPNSVRLSGPCSTGTDSCTIEFMPTVGGGRYRAGSGGDELDFTKSDTTFDVLGPMPSMTTANQIVVYNLGIPEADAYEGNTGATHVRRAVSQVNASSLTIVSSAALPFDSPGHRFHAVTQPVKYVCAANASNPALGTLSRIAGYGWPEAVVTGTSTLIAKNVSNCRFTYDSQVVAQRSGLVTMKLSITESDMDGQNETITLYNAAHVSNQP